MADKFDDRNWLERQLENVMDQLAENRKEREKLIAKRERLEKVRDTIEIEEKACGKLVKSEKKFLEKKRKWKGNNYNIYEGNVLELSTNNDDYDYDLNCMLDDINTEIALLKVQIGQRTGFISSLKSSAEYWGTQIGNLLN